LEQIAIALGIEARFTGTSNGWSIDTRTLAFGDTFIALRGPNHDGHDHVQTAASLGAVAAIVEHPIAAPIPQFVVTHTLDALQQLASWARLLWGGEVIGITGSAGKTTTKDVVAALVSTVTPVGKTIGNFNNNVGLPLSLLRLPETARVGVIELGMNHAGEIRDLAVIAKPKVGIVTNVSYAHVENFEGIEGIAAAKRELIEALPAGGTAILNYDDERVREFASATSAHIITYGLDEGADLRAENLEITTESATFRVDDATFTTKMTGRHSVRNILAGIAAARLYGAKTEDLLAAVAALEPAKMRGERLVHNGILIYNDCYNSNPDAVKAMLDVLRESAGTSAGPRTSGAMTT